MLRFGMNGTRTDTCLAGGSGCVATRAVVDTTESCVRPALVSVTDVAVAVPNHPRWGYGRGTANEQTASAGQTTVTSPVVTAGGDE